VQAIIFGLLTAACFASGAVASSRTSRTIGPYSTIAGIAVVGMIITAPFLIHAGMPTQMDGAKFGWLMGVGIGSLGGLVLSYMAFRVGKVGVVAPIVSTEGAIAAVLSVLFGESIAPLVGMLLVFIVAAVIAAAIAPDPAPVAHEQPLRAALLAVAAAAAFGVGLYSSGHLSTELPIAWILLPARLIGVVAIAAPLLITRRFVMTRVAAPLVVLTGITEVLGFTFYSMGAQHSVAITAVLASLFAPIAAVAAFLLFGERLGKLQIAAVSTIVVGVVALSLAVA